MDTHNLILEKRSSRYLLCAALLITLLHSVLILQWSARQGRLALPVYYDDNHSLVDGARRLEIWQLHGISEVIKDYKATPPHAPGHSAIAAISFALLGFHAWAPYLTNVLFLGLVLLALHLALGSSDWRLQAACMLLITCAPIAGIAILEYRSEINVAALGALGVSLFLSWSMNRSETSWRLLSASLCFAACFLIKPAVFPYTLGLMGLCMIYHLGTEIFTAGRVVITSVRDLLIFTLAAVLPALPHYILDWRHITFYIQHNAFSSSSIWLRHDDLLTGLLFHITGYPGRIMLGHCQMPVSLVITAALLLRLLRSTNWPKDLPLISLFYFTTGAYLGVAVNPMNQNYFGMTFHWLFLITGAVALTGIVRLLLPSLIGGISIVLMLLGSILFFGLKLPPSIDFYREKTAGNPAVFSWLKESPDLVLKPLIRLNRMHGSTHVLLTATTMINGRTLEWYTLIQREPFIYRDFFEGKLESFKSMLPWAEIVISPEEGTPSLESILPSAAMIPQMITLLDNDPDFELVERLPSPKNGPGFRIYARRQTENKENSKTF